MGSFPSFPPTVMAGLAPAIHEAPSHCGFSESVKKDSGPKISVRVGGRVKPGHDVHVARPKGEREAVNLCAEARID
jgi:hypothetical protein